MVYFELLFDLLLLLQIFICVILIENSLLNVYKLYESYFNGCFYILEIIVVHELYQALRR